MQSRHCSLTASAARIHLLVILAVAAGCTPQTQPPERPAPEPAPATIPPPAPARPRITPAENIIRRMHDRYAGRWYRTLRYEQSNTFYTQSGGEQKSRWLHHVSVPGRMRIDFMPLESRSGLLVVNNTVTTFDNGRRVDSRQSIQPVPTLTADVYAVPVAVTLRRLDALGVDLDRVHETRMNRRRLYVIGAHRGDLSRTQVWIDGQRMLLVRYIQRERRGDAYVTTDTHVSDYRTVEGFPIPHLHVATRDGKPLFREQYENVRVNEPLPAGVFDPSRWVSSRPAN